MLIIYNPLTGSPIPKFSYDGNWYHKIDKEEVALGVGEILQFPDNVGEFMVKNWGFLEQVTAEKAAEIKETAKLLKCDFCEFTFDNPLAKTGHEKSHQKEPATVQEIVPDIPMVATTPAESRINTQEATRDVDDLKGPDWYGPGLTQDK